MSDANSKRYQLESGSELVTETVELSLAAHTSLTDRAVAEFSARASLSHCNGEHSRLITLLLSQMLFLEHNTDNFSIENALPIFATLNDTLRTISGEREADEEATLQ